MAAFAATAYPGTYSNQENRPGHSSHASLMMHHNASSALPAINAMGPHAGGFAYGQVDAASQPLALHRQDFIPMPSRGLWQPPQAPRMTSAAARASVYPSLDTQSYNFGHAYPSMGNLWQPPALAMAHHSQLNQQVDHRILLHPQVNKMMQDYHPCGTSGLLTFATPHTAQFHPGHPSLVQSHGFPHHDLPAPPIPAASGDNWLDTRPNVGNSNDFVDHAIRRAEANRAAQEWHEGHNGPVAWSQRSVNVPGHQQQPLGAARYHPSDFSTGRGSVGSNNPNLPARADWNQSGQPIPLSDRGQASFGWHGRRDSTAPVDGWCRPESYQGADDFADPLPSELSRNEMVPLRYDQTSGFTQVPHVSDGWRRLGQNSPVSFHQDGAYNSQSQFVNAFRSNGIMQGPTLEEPDNYHHQASRWLGSDEYSPGHGEEDEMIQDTCIEPLQAEANADPQSKEPAPPSPDTLDKSSVPLAAFGAQLIWNVCAAFFDPTLLREAHVGTEGHQTINDGAVHHLYAAVGSASSSPSVSTPANSPWMPSGFEKSAAVTGEWNAFRSPFGPDRAQTLRRHHQSIDLGSASFLHSDASNSLHRLAVGAHGRTLSSSGQLRPVPFSRHRSTSNSLGFLYPETGPGHSSSASTSSCCSEPGTPTFAAADCMSESTGTVARANPCAAPVGMGHLLDRCQSDSGVRAPRRSFNGPSSSFKRADKARENVLSALRLVSPTWRWSSNDEKLVSLESQQCNPLAILFSRSMTSLSQHAVGSSVAAASHASEPSPALRRFAHQVLAQTLLSPTAFLLGILYALRVPLLALQPDGKIDPEALEIFAQPTSAAPFKLFTLGMMIANKHLDDNTFLNKTWNEVTAIPLAELNQIESWFLRKCNYEITVPDETWVAFLENLKLREEAKPCVPLTKPANYSDATKNDGYRSQQDKVPSRSPDGDDCTKRLLIILEEALAQFGAVHKFELDGPNTMPMSSPESSTVLANSEWGRMKKQRPEPDFVPTQRHHHPQHPGSIVAAMLGSDDDVFDDEHSPFRPAHYWSGCGSGSFLAHSSDLNRSRSEFCESNAVARTSNDQIRMSAATLSAPLVPSALLQGGRALLHGSSFVPLAASAWTRH